MALAGHVGVPVQRVNEIIRGKRGITPETAWLFSQAFGTSPEFWINLQTNYDLARTRPKEKHIQLLQLPRNSANAEDAGGSPVSVTKAT